MGVVIGAPTDRIRQSLFNHHPRHSSPPAGSATITLDPDKSHDLFSTSFLNLEAAADEPLLNVA
jgi:hypothetical protein